MNNNNTLQIIENEKDEMIQKEEENKEKTLVNKNNIYEMDLLKYAKLY